MRLFIGIKLSDLLKKEIARVCESLKKFNSDVKWVEIENIHLTLKFLGEVKEEELVNLDCIKEISQKNLPFIYEIQGIGGFPNIKHPRVIWIGINNGKEKIIEICKSLDEILCKVGFKKEEKGFNPHITIGRIRSNKNLSVLISNIQRVTVSNLKEEVKSIYLIKSVLTPSGPIYTDIKEFN
jgi:2'-5' RNA ligase